MKIAKDCAVSFHFTLSNTEGEVLQTTVGEEPLTYIHGYQNILPGLEDNLEGLEAGAKGEFHLLASDAFGEHDPEAIMEIPLSSLPADTEIEVGDCLEIQADAEDGGIEPMMVTVVEVGESAVTLDGNHPLAGEDLNVTVEILEVRTATEEERAHGHVHGQGGCGGE